MTQTDTINEKLREVNGLICPYQLAYISLPDDCVLLEKNARYMDKEVFDRLRCNIEEDGFLSQLPFCMRRADGKYLVLSGNHRVKAAIQAGLANILILYIEEVDKDTQLAYQLSHNSLVGRDDMQILRDIYEEIGNVEKKEFSGLSEVNFADIAQMPVTTFGEGDIELTELKLQFVESRKNQIDEVLDTLEKAIINENSRIVVGSYDAFIEVMTAVKRRYDIKSKSIAFSKMIEICANKLAEEIENTDGGE